MSTKSQNISRILTLLTSTVTILGLAACTRPNNDNSQISISFPKQMTSKKLNGLNTTEVAAHVVVNVSWPESPNPIDRSWDACQECFFTEPPIFSIDVPSGTNRVVQVLAIYQDIDTEKMTFYYGESLPLSLSGGSTPVAIEVKPLGLSQTIISGQVSGRLLTGPNAGPTGPVTVKYNPNNGRPAMVIERSHILAGWFSFFMLTEAKLEYWHNGGLLFGGPASLDDAQFFPEGSMANRIRMHMPVSLREQYENNTPTFRIREPQIMVWGYWSADASLLSGKYACHDFTSPLTRMTVFSNDLNGTTPLGLQGLSSAGAFSTTEQLSNTISPLTSADYTGGFNVSGGTCNGVNFTDATQFTQLLGVESSSIDGEGKEKAAGFYGPFRPGSNGLFAVTPGVSNTVIDGDVLPGIEQVFNGFRAFKMIVGFDGGGQRENTTSCFDLPQRGFFEAGSGPISTTGSYSLDLNVSQAERDAGTMVVMCPTINDAMMGQGYFINPWHFGGMNGNNNGPYLRMEVHSSPDGGLHNGINGPNEQYRLQPGKCFEVKMRVFPEGSTSEIPLISIAPSANSDLKYFNSATDCTSNPGSANPGGMTRQLADSAPNSGFASEAPSFWIKYTGALSGTATDTAGLAISFDANSDIRNDADQTNYFLFDADSTNFTGNNAGVPVQVNAIPATAVTENSCVSFHIKIQDAGGAYANLAAGKTVNLNGSNAGYFYSDAGCTVGQTLTSSVNIASGSPSTYATAYFKGPLNSNFNFSVNMGTFTLNNSFMMPALNFTQVSNSAAVAGNNGQIAVDSAGNVYYGAVNELKIRKIDGAGTDTAIAGGFDGNFTDGVGFAATFWQPTMLAIDNSDNLYIADGFKIRKLVTATNTVSTVGTMAAGGTQTGIASDNSGNVYFTFDDAGSGAATVHRVMKMTSAGVVSVLAGSGTAGFNDATAASAQFNFPIGLAYDPTNDDLYVADSGNFAIRRIDLSTGAVVTIAGNGSQGQNDSLGAAATFNFYASGFNYGHMGIENGFLFFGDMNFSAGGRNTIRRIDIGGGSNYGDVMTYCGPGSPWVQGDCSMTGVYSRFGLSIRNNMLYFMDGSVLKRVSYQTNW